MSQQALQSYTDDLYTESIRLCLNSAPLCVNMSWGATDKKTEGCKHTKNRNRGIEEVLPGNTSTANTHDRMMKHTELYMLPKQCWFWSARLFYRCSFCVFPQQRFRELPTLLFFFFLCLFPVSLDSFSTPLAGCTEDALNPVQVVVGGTHTQRLAPRAVFDLPLFHVLQHTEGPAFCKIGGRGGGGKSLLSWHWLKLLSITCEQS